MTEEHDTLYSARNNRTIRGTFDLLLGNHSIHVTDHSSSILLSISYRGILLSVSWVTFLLVLLSISYRDIFLSVTWVTFLIGLLSNSYWDVFLSVSRITIFLRELSIMVTGSFLLWSQSPFYISFWV